MQHKALSGFLARKKGKAFEKWIEACLRQSGWIVLAIQDGCRPTGFGGRSLQRVVQPFDFVALGPNNQNIFFDAKVRSGAKHPIASWTSGGLKKTKTGKLIPDSTMQQKLKLREIAMTGRPAGFVILVADTNEIHWVSAMDADNPTGKSKCWGHFPRIVNIFI